MKLTRSQLIVLVVLGLLTIGVYGCLISTVVRNSRQMAQVITPAPLPSPEEPTSTPTATPSPTPTPTPTPIAPQTRYDLQVARDPQNPALRLQRGYAYIALGAYIYAVQDFDVAISLDDTLAEAYLGRGEAHFYLKEWSAALEDFNRALALDPELADAYLWRGQLLSIQRKHTPALEVLRQAVALDETDAMKRVALAQALLRSGDAEAAEIEFTKALTLETRLAEAYVGRAMALAEQGDFDAAQADLDAARAIAPYEPVVLNAQAWLYAWYRQDHLDEAERLALLAVDGARYDLERAAYLDTLGWVYYQQGRYDEAIAVLEDAATLATVEGEVVYDEILEHLEEVRQAR